MDETWMGSNRSIEGLNKLGSPSGMKTRGKRVAQEHHFKMVCGERRLEHGISDYRVDP